MDIEPDYQVHGAIFNDHTWINVSWWRGGRYLGSQNQPSGEHPHDIISEWREPKQKRIAYTDVNGNVRLVPEGYLIWDGWERVPWLDETK